MSTPSPAPDRTPSPPPSPLDHPDPCSCHPSFADGQNKRLSIFFKEHIHNTPDFKPRPHDFLSIEFGRLARYKGWKNKERDRKWIECLISEFELHLEDCFDRPVAVQDREGKLDRVIKGRHAELYRLCMKFECYRSEASITECIMGLHRVHVNLLDWLDCMRRGNKPYYFPSKRKYDDYMLFQQRFLPGPVVDAIPILLPLVKRPVPLIEMVEAEEYGRGRNLASI